MILRGFKTANSSTTHLYAYAFFTNGKCLSLSSGINSATALAVRFTNVVIELSPDSFSGTT